MNKLHLICCVIALFALAGCANNVAQNATPNITTNTTVEAAVNTTVVEPSPVEPAVNSTPNATEIPDTNASAAVIPDINTTLNQPMLSFTEQCEHDFYALNRTYFYQADTKDYGKMWVVHMVGKTKYTSPDIMFTVNSSDNHTVIASKYHIEMWTEDFMSDVRARYIPVMDYIAHENDTYYGCYVDVGYYKRENCALDNATNRTRIIFENISFTPPEDPMDWLHKFDGKTPYLVKYNYTNKEDNLVRNVDEAYFNNSDGTRTRLVIQKFERLPLQVNIIGFDNKVNQTIYFHYLSTNMADLKKWSPWFFDS